MVVDSHEIVRVRTDDFRYPKLANCLDARYACDNIQVPVFQYQFVPETKEVSVGQDLVVDNRLLSAICSFALQDKTCLHVKTDNLHGLDLDLNSASGIA